VSVHVSVCACVYVCDSVQVCMSVCECVCACERERVLWVYVRDQRERECV